MYSNNTIGKKKMLFTLVYIFTIISYPLLAQNRSLPITERADSVQSNLLSPEQTLKRHRISDLQLSPDGNQIAMTVTEPVKGTRSNSDIWILEVKTRECHRFTTSEKSDNRPRWSPDGKSLAFLSSRSEKTQIYLLHMRGGEAESLTQGENGIRSFEWSPDGKKIAFLATEPKTEEEEKKEKDKDDARVADHDDRHARLWILDVESRDIQQLTHGDWRIA